MITMESWNGVPVGAESKQDMIEKMVERLKEGESKWGYTFCGDTIIVAFWDKNLNGTGGFEIFDCMVRNVGEFPFPAFLMKDENDYSN
jgi:hypothetical protein